MSPAQPNNQEADDNHDYAEHHEQYDMVGTGERQRVTRRAGANAAHPPGGDDRSHQGAPAP
jgi:hypothetical protein